ncbi:hypothetical protein P9265_16775 [Schinkia azotoformans]|uniref:hypothetical protein n=1 Tax=Schinkia azotoformans TaxID=1454 RepID=UPI002E21F8CD|nr:hypothetical protein [Schinkia azotoformans]
MKIITLNKTNLSDLAELSIGKRVRYIREHLQKECGNAFSGKSVANRIKLFSQSTLTTIERDKSKDIPSKVLYAISKDFGADLDMFFDDYYQYSTYETVELTPPLYIEDTHKESESEAEQTEDQYDSEINPLLENEYTIKTMVSKVASNQDEQLTFIFKSRVKYSEQHLFYLLSQIINQMNTLDASIEPDLTEGSLESIRLARDYINHGKTSLHAFPWYFSEDKLVMDNQSYEKAIRYTEHLMKGLKNQDTKGEDQNE